MSVDIRAKGRDPPTLDDLRASLDRDTDEPYFLGSVVLVKEKGVPACEVIDGRQGLTTLTVLSLCSAIWQSPRQTSVHGARTAGNEMPQAGTRVNDEDSDTRGDAQQLTFQARTLQSVGDALILPPKVVNDIESALRFATMSPQEIEQFEIERTGLITGSGPDQSVWAARHRKDSSGARDRHSAWPTDYRDERTSVDRRDLR
jgi:hypothetical protein